MNSSRFTTIVTDPNSRPPTPRTPAVPDYPNDLGNSAWAIDMNYLMPFSVMLMILCVLLLILCYLRHRMRQRRQLQRELRLSQIMRNTGDMRRFDEFGMPDRLVMMYPPTYDEATLSNDQAIQKNTFDSSELPPPYTEYHQQQPTHSSARGTATTANNSSLDASHFTEQPASSRSCDSESSVHQN